MSSTRPMRPIPVSAAKRIAQEYGYDQVVVIARRVGEAPDPHGEHVTTYGVSEEHCRSAAMQGNALKKFTGWTCRHEFPLCPHGECDRDCSEGCEASLEHDYYCTCSCAKPCTGVCGCEGCKTGYIDEAGDAP